MGLIGALVPARHGAGEIFQRTPVGAGCFMGWVWCMSGDRIGLAVCTYKRPEGLRKLLLSLPGSTEAIPHLEVIVVDNDGNDPAISLMSQALDCPKLPITYVVEKKPGISAARNRALDVARQKDLTFLAMLDDDEWPDTGWLDALVAKHAETRAVVVSALVEPVFPHSCAHLERFSQFWAVQPQLRDGRPFVHATSAILLDMEQLSGLGDPRFDDAFGLSGGGDLVFFSGLFEMGAVMAWAEDALVFEDVPQKRASIAWLSKRRFRVGNHMAMDEKLRAGPLRAAIKTLGLCARLPIYPFLGREPGAWRQGWRLEWHKVRGRIAAHFGAHVFEYARDGVGLRRARGL